MSTPNANITIPVDLTNPGQFFACCGLLEVAGRISHGAEGWFENAKFCLSCATDLRTLLTCLILDPPQQRDFICGNLRIKPIVAPLALTFDGDATERFVLDSWTRTITKSGTVQAVAAPPWNLWSGNQKPLTIWLKLRDELRVILAGDLQLNSQPASDTQLENLFLLTRPLTGRFGFDSTAAWNAQDVGFSPNDQNLAVESSPATELLAAVGLQRFRPVIRDRVPRYQIWNCAAAPSVAAAMACGAIQHGGRAYNFGIVKRGQYSAFNDARPVNGESNYD